MPKRNETALVKAAIDFLTMKGIRAWRENSGGMTATHNGKKRFVKFSGAPGKSDIIGILPNGRFLAVECKTGKNKPTEIQQAFLAMVKDAGGLAIVAWDLDDIDEQLKLGESA